MNEKKYTKVAEIKLKFTSLVFISVFIRRRRRKKRKEIYCLKFKRM
jgi:hypothetical protein